LNSKEIKHTEKKKAKQMLGFFCVAGTGLEPATFGL